MKFLVEKFRKVYDKKIDGTGLAIFRIMYATVLLFELSHIFYFRHLFFDKIPYLIPSSLDYTFPIIIWAVFIIMMLFGWFTRVATIGNYVMSVFILDVTSDYEYHVHYVYLGLNFLLMFLPISRCISIDRLRLKLKYSSVNKRYKPPSKVSYFAYTIPLLISVAFFYLDSVLFKFVSPLWADGMGMWMPANMPMGTHLDSSWYMNLKQIVIALGYLTMIFEFVFVFIFWFKPFRIPLFLIGFCLHVGILLEFPIPWFAFCMLSLYFLLVPVGYWRKIGAWMKKPKHKLSLYYNSKSLKDTKAIALINHFDWFNQVNTVSSKEEGLPDNISQKELAKGVVGLDAKGNRSKGMDAVLNALAIPGVLAIPGLLFKIPGIKQLATKIISFLTKGAKKEAPKSDKKVKAFGNFSLYNLKFIGATIGIFGLCLIQFIVSYNSGIMTRYLANFNKSSLGKSMQKLSVSTENVTKQYLGITKHALFMDYHFSGYNHIVAVTYKKDGKEIFLPLIDENGMPGDYISGSTWAKLSFRTNGPYVNQNVLAAGLRDFTAFWAKKNNVSLDNTTFNIKVKKVRVPTGWERDFLKKAMKNPWIEAGTISWVNKQFRPNIKVIESL